MRKSFSVYVVLLEKVPAAGVSVRVTVVVLPGAGVGRVKVPSPLSVMLMPSAVAATVP